MNEHEWMNMNNEYEHYQQGSSYGGRRRAGPPTTHDFRPAQVFFCFFV